MIKYFSRGQKVLMVQPKRTDLRKISGWIGYTPARMSQIMSLIFLSPLIQEEILLSSKSSLHQLIITIAYNISQELSWDKQNELWIQARDKEILVEIASATLINLAKIFVFSRPWCTPTVRLTL